MPQFRLTQKFATDCKIKQLFEPVNTIHPLDDWFIDSLIVDRKINLQKETGGYTRTLYVGPDVFTYRSKFKDLRYIAGDDDLTILGDVVLEKTIEYGWRWPFHRKVAWSIVVHTEHLVATHGKDYSKQIQTALINAGLNQASIVLHPTLLSQVLLAPLGEVQRLLERARQDIGVPLAEVKAA